MPYLYKDICYETIEAAASHDMSAGVITLNNDVFSPVSFVISSGDAFFTYQNENNQSIQLIRHYPSCTDIGYPSITGMSFDDAILLNGSVITLWCIAFGIRAIRKSF